MASKFNIVITVFKTCRRKISIFNTKYYESPFENFKVRKNDIIITKVSKNNSKELNNEYYNLESIFEKFILWIWTCQKPIDTQQKSKHSISIFRIIRFKMSSDCFREALGVRNVFTYVDIGRIRGFEPKKRFWNLIQALCDYE